MDNALRVVASPQPVEAVQEARPPDTFLFAADRAAGADQLARAPAARLLAELALHRQAETPFCIGLLGAPGAGKSTFVDQIVAAADGLSAAASDAGLASCFVGEALMVRVEAAEGDPESLLTGAVVHRIGETHPALAAELRHAGIDPAEAARTAAETLDGKRRQLDAERQALDALSGRDARLVDTVLDTPGAPVDAYARAKRSRLERSLRQFGFGAGDPIATYKDLVRDAAEQVGSPSRASLSLRALYAYAGQTRLIVGAILMALLAWGCAIARTDRQSWLDAIRGFGDRAGPVADWLQAHVHWLAAAETALLLLAVLLLLLNVIRAARFVLPIARGVDLLQQDLEGRRRDLANLIAHQTRRVDALTAEAAAAARHAEDAERRAGTQPGAGTAAVRLDMPRPQGARTAALFRTLATAMAAGQGGAGAPDRILVFIDGLDQLSSEAAARLLAAARRLFGPGIVTIAAAAQSHLVAGFGETDPARATAQLSRCIQVPYRVGAADGAEAERRALARSLVGGSPEVAAVAASDIDARRSLLDLPWRPREGDIVAALAPFAGETPRAIKTYVNLYRIARADPRLAGAPRPVLTALALALALDGHGFPEDLSALERASHGEAAGDSPILRRALAAAREASGEMVELGQAQRALDVAASYSRRLVA